MTFKGLGSTIRSERKVDEAFTLSGFFRELRPK
jgi:hypothetical protein